MSRTRVIRVSPPLANPWPRVTNIVPVSPFTDPGYNGTWQPIWVTSVTPGQTSCHLHSQICSIMKCGEGSTFIWFDQFSLLLVSNNFDNQGFKVETNVLFICWHSIRTNKQSLDLMAFRGNDWSGLSLTALWLAVTVLTLDNNWQTVSPNNCHE